MKLFGPQNETIAFRTEMPQPDNIVFDKNHIVIEEPRVSCKDTHTEIEECGIVTDEKEIETPRNQKSKYSFMSKGEPLVAAKRSRTPYKHKWLFFFACLFRYSLLFSGAKTVYARINKYTHIFRTDEW